MLTTKNVLARKTSLAIPALLTVMLLLPACAALELAASWSDSEGPVPPHFSDSNLDPGRPWANWRTPQEESETPRMAQSRMESSYGARESDLTESGTSRKNGIRMGMTLKDVRRLWGTPTDVEVAGDPTDGNFRWTYPSSTVRDLASSRVVTFESGRVAGWETVRPE